LQLMEHLDSDFFDLNYEFLDMSMELAKMNPCDLVHQTRLVTFMQDWIVDGLVSGFSDATAFGDWLDDRLEDCQILFSSSSYRANVQVWNAGGSALGGHSPASGIEGLTRFQNCSSVEKKIEFSVQKQVTYWDRGAEDWNSKWVDAQLSHMRLGVCPCTGTDFTEDRCRSRVCPQIGPSNGNVQGSHTVFTEDQEGIYNVVTTKWNQAWDPIYSTGTQGLAAYTQGSVPCDHAAVQNSEVIPSSMTTNPPRWARGFCSGKNLQRGSVAFHRDHVYDVDAWLRSTTDGFTSFRKISEDPNGVIMKQIGHLQARISAHNPDVAASDIFPKSRFSETNWIKLYSETGIKGHSQIAQPLYEKEGCATGWAIHHWNPQVIHVAPTLEGPLGDPIPWAFVKNTDGPHVLQLFGPDGIRVQTVMELPATVMQVSPWRSGAAKTFLLAHQRNGVVHRLQLADASPLGITNEKEMVGVLPAVEDPVWVRTGENRLLLAGRRAGAIWLYAVWVLEPDRLPIGLTISVPLGRISGSSVALSKQENTVIAAVGDGTRVRLWQVQPTQPYVQRGEFATAESVENIVHHDMTWLLKTTQSLLKWTPDIGLAAMPTAGLPSDRSGCAVSVSPEGSPVLLCPKSADGVLPVGYTLKDGNWEVRSCYASF